MTWRTSLERTSKSFDCVANFSKKCLWLLYLDLVRQGHDAGYYALNKLSSVWKCNNGIEVMSDYWAVHARVQQRLVEMPIIDQPQCASVADFSNCLKRMFVDAHLKQSVNIGKVEFAKPRVCSVSELINNFTGYLPHYRDICARSRSSSTTKDWAGSFHHQFHVHLESSCLFNGFTDFPRHPKIALLLRRCFAFAFVFVFVVAERILQASGCAVSACLAR